MANDLEPCPFCSSDNVGLETRRPSGFAYGVCRDCGAEGPCEDHSSSAEDYWNRRPAPVALTDALPELPQHPEKYHNWTAHERAAIQQYAQQCIEARNQQGDAVDAVRYRHLRAAATFGGRDTFDLRWYLPRFGQGDMRERLDAAIDAAIEQRKADKKGNV